MKFHFSYEILLKHRKALEDSAMREYMAAKGLLDEHMRLLDRMYEKIEQARLLIGEIQKQGGRRAQELQAIETFIKGKNIEITNQRLVIRDHLQKVEVKHEKLIVAAQERKAIDKLREKRLQKFKKQQQRLEQKQVDDLVVMRYNRGER